MAHRADLFLHTVSELRSGRTQQELSETLNDLVGKCRDTGKKGAITLKISIIPDKGDTGQYFLTDTITTKEPEFERGQTIMWGTPDGNLQRTDPSQGELNLRAVSEEQTPARQVVETQQTPKSL